MSKRYCTWIVQHGMYSIQNQGSWAVRNFKWKVHVLHLDLNFLIIFIVEITSCFDRANICSLTILRIQTAGRIKYNIVLFIVSLKKNKLGNLCILQHLQHSDLCILIFQLHLYCPESNPVIFINIFFSLYINTNYITLVILIKITTVYLANTTYDRALIILLWQKLEGPRVLLLKRAIKISWASSIRLPIWTYFPEIHRYVTLQSLVIFQVVLMSTLYMQALSPHDLTWKGTLH